MQHSRMLTTGNENEDDRNVMVNFKPGEYVKKMIFHSVTQAAQKKNLSTLNREEKCKSHVTVVAKSLDHNNRELKQ